ncbi:hypothetical protein NKH84_14510 [Mesorhizobium sp. M0902]|uniref:hypothetical protein n=1 Tax=Mesorhizobium sp. M0902 TaxID=2957021 RepID=UPI00333CC196
MRTIVLLCSAVLFSLAHIPARAEEPSVERGLYVSITGGCHDCHTMGYRESGGKIDPEKALKGSNIGFRGPWGTSYPANLRLMVADDGEDEFVRIARFFDAAPPMPWYNLRKMDETDVRSRRHSKPGRKRVGEALDRTGINRPVERDFWNPHASERPSLVIKISARRDELVNGM